MENINQIDQNQVQNAGPRINIPLITGVIVVIIVLSVLAFYFFKKPNLLFQKTNPAVAPSSKNALPTPEPNGPFKYSAKVTPPTKFKGNLPLVLSDKGFSEKVLVMEKGSGVILFNSTSKDATVTITDAVDKPLDKIVIPAQKGWIPLTYDAGTYKFKDDKGNTAIITLTP